MKNAVYPILFVLLSSIAIAACPSSMVSYWDLGYTYDDDFSSSSLNTTRWTAVPGAHTITQSGGKLTLSLAPGSGTQGTQVNANSYMTGDFDIQVDYGDWVLGTYNNAGGPVLMVKSAGDDFLYFRRDRVSQTYQVYGVVNGAWNAAGTTASTATSGTMRIKKSGNTLSAYYWSGSAWTLVGSYSSNEYLQNMYTVLHFVFDNTGGTNSVSFDNYKVNSGETTTDSVGSKNGIILNATSVGGKIGRGLNFYAVGDQVVSSGHSALGTINQPYSITGWFKPASGTTQGVLVHVSGQADGLGWCVQFMRMVGGKLQANSWSGTPPWTAASGNTIVNDGQWHHFANTWDSTNGLRLYVDGVLDASASQSSYAATSAANYVFFGPYVVGCGDANAQFNGTMDEMAIYNTALTAQEVADLYYGSKNSYDYCSGAAAFSEPDWGSDLNLTTTDGTVITEFTNATTLQIRAVSTPQVEFTRSGSLNLTSLVLDSDRSRTVVDLSSVTGVTGAHALYVNNTGSVYVCPSATTINQVTPVCAGLVTLNCPGSSGQYSCTVDGNLAKVSGLTGSGIGSGCDHCDDCDSGLYCNLTAAVPTCEATTGSTPACMDCLDNDGDSNYDYIGYSGPPGDAQCTSNLGTSESPAASTDVPEFSTIGMILALGAVLGTVVLRRRK